MFHSQLDDRLPFYDDSCPQITLTVDTCKIGKSFTKISSKVEFV